MKLDGEWLGFEEHLAQAEAETAQWEADLIMSRLPSRTEPEAPPPPPVATYEQHIVLAFA